MNDSKAGIKLEEAFALTISQFAGGVVRQQRLTTQPRQSFRPVSFDTVSVNSQRKASLPQHVIHMRQNLTERACSEAGGGLTPDEWSRYIPDLTYQGTCAP